jgi:hypothetical protein
MYIPKNKIQTDIFTSGEEYTDVNGNFYTGYYYKLYNGTFFSGRYPEEIPNSIQLYPYSEAVEPAKNTNGSNTFKLFPTPNDYKVGYFTRYFIKRRNQLLYFELDKEEYTSFLNGRDLQNTFIMPQGLPFNSPPNQSLKALNTAFTLKWVLTGDINNVAKVNQNMVKLAESQNKILGLGVYLKEDYTKYYK